MTTTTAPESVASGCARVRWGTRADGFRRFRRLAVECMIGGRGETPDGVHHRESARRGTTKRMVLDDDYRGKPLHRESTQRQGGLGRRSARAQQRHHTSRRIVSVRRCGCAGPDWLWPKWLSRRDVDLMCHCRSYSGEFD